MIIAKWNGFLINIRRASASFKKIQITDVAF